jgi:putative oxidoreductase
MWNTAYLIGRVAVVAIFIMSGGSKLMNLSGTAGYIASKGLPMPEVLALAAALAELVLGLAIAVGFKTRLAALGLAAFTVLATLFFHDFWNMEGQARAANLISAQKNLSIVGALLMLAAVGAGRFAVDRSSAAVAEWRGGREASSRA